MLDRDWLDGLIRDVFRSLDSETTMSHDEQMAAWEGMRRLKEAILATPEPPSTSVPCDHIVKAGWFGDTPLTKIRGAKFCVECGAALKDREGE